MNPQHLTLNSIRLISLDFSVIIIPRPMPNGGVVFLG
jgi:hypothetical protein